MRNVLYSALAVTILIGMTGCQWAQSKGLVGGGARGDGCSSCDVGKVGNFDECVCGEVACKKGCRLVEPPCDVAAPAGPPVGAVTYPYYTTRGPRDFLTGNPRPIGP